MAAVAVPVLFLVLLSLGAGFAVLYTKHRRLQSSFSAFASSHYSSRLGSAIFSSGDDLGMWDGAVLRATGAGALAGRGSPGGGLRCGCRAQAMGTHRGLLCL